MRRSLPSSLALAATLGGALVASASFALTPDHRLGHEAVPAFEAVWLRLDADSARYDGRVRIQLDVPAATDSFQLEERGLTLRKLVLRGPRGPVDATHAVGEHDLLTV